VDVVVSGSHGLIGGALVADLRAHGDRAIVLARGTAAGSNQHGSDELRWDPAAGRIDAAGLEGVDAVVHLAGAGIADRRWNEARKRVVLESRVQGTTVLAAAIAGCQRPPPLLISASAVGVYGDRGDDELTEASAIGSGFLADLCRQWEAATGPAEQAGVRVVHARSGIVLTADGGALPRMALPFKFGAGGRLGSGRQWMSWITLVDEIAALRHLLTGDRRGPVNLTAPVPVTNREFTATLGRVLHRPAVLAVPSAALRFALGREMVDEMFLASARVLPRVLETDGFRYAHPDLDGALRAVFARH